MIAGMSLAKQSVASGHAFQQSGADGCSGGQHGIPAMSSTSATCAISALEVACPHAMPANPCGTMNIPRIATIMSARVTTDDKHIGGSLHKWGHQESRVTSQRCDTPVDVEHGDVVAPERISAAICSGRCAPRQAGVVRAVETFARRLKGLTVSPSPQSSNQEHRP